MSPHARDLEPIENISKVLNSENVRKQRSRRVWALLLLVVVAVLGWFLARGRTASGPTFEFTEWSTRNLEVTVTAVGQPVPTTSPPRPGRQPGPSCGRPERCFGSRR